MLWYNAGMKANALFCSAVCCCVSFALPCAADVGQPASPERRCERHYDFRAKLCQVHKRGVRDAAIRPAAGDFVLADGVTIAIPGIGGGSVPATVCKG